MRGMQEYLDIYCKPSHNNLLPRIYYYLRYRHRYIPYTNTHIIMFKLSTLLSLSTALTMTRTSIAQDDMAAMEELLKVVECLSTDGESLLTDDCTCNDLKGLADMESEIGSQFEDSGLVLQSFKDCCEDGTTNEEYTQCIYNPDLGGDDEGVGSSEDGVGAD